MTNSADNNDTNAVAPDTVSIESTNDAGVQSATMVQDVCNIATAEGIEGVVAPVVVDKPDANDPYSLLIEPGKEYFLDFEESEVANMSLDGDNLIITLDNGGVLTLIDFVDATNNPDLPATAAFRDPFALSDFAEMMPAVVDTVPDEAELEEPQAEIREEVAQIEPAAGDEPAAEQLAQIEPAAGDEGGAGGSRGGYGYQSSFDAQGIDGLDDVGPIDPTALQYGVNFNNEILFPPQQQTPVGPVDSQPVVNQPTSVLDETNFDTGGNVANGTIVVNFGNDGPGTIAPDGTFTINGSVPAGGLMSGGDSVVITQTANGYVGVTTGGVTVFELTIDPLTGDYTYTQYAPFDHADGTDPNDLITIDFGVVATDADGDSVNTTVQINVFDDAPVLDDDNLGTLSEDALDTGPVTLNGNLIEDGGEDSAAVITTNGNDFQASGSMAGGVLSSGGEAVSVTATADGYVGTLADGTVVFELTITNSATGEYTFTLYQALDHGAAGPDVITLDFGVLITDFDGDTDDATITINIEDGEPTIPGNDNPQIGEGLENVDETDLNGGTISQSGTLPVDFGNDGPGEVKGDGTFTIDGVTTLTSGGQPVDVTYDAATGTYTGTAGGQTIFTLTIDPVTGDYTFTLLGQIDHPDATDPNDVIQLQFGVCVLDADGDIATGQILINVFDDAPIAVDDNVTLPTNVDPVSGNVTDNDDSGADVDAHVTNVNFDGVDYPVVEGTPTVITTPYGELVINADGSYTYTPNGTNPDPVMEQFIYTYTDADGDSDTAVLTVNITADDQPIIISVDPLLVDETDMNPTDTDSGVITADFGNDDPGTFAGDGTFDLGGLTSDGQPITVTFDAATGTYTGTAGGNLIFTFTINADGTYNFELFGAVDHPDPTDPNDAVVINFGVVATDADGDSANGTVTVTILDDGPTVSPMQVVPVVDETDLGNGVVQANGNVNFDFGQDGAGTVEGNGGFSVQEVPNLTSGGIPVDVTYDAATGTYTGTAGGNVIFTLALDTQTGEYVFTLVGTLDHPDPTDPNDALNLEFGITVTDGDGDTVDGTITVTVLDDGPVITTPAAVSVDESHFDGSSGISTTGNIGIDYGADGEGEFSGTDDIIITTVGPGPSTTLDSLTSGGQPVTISFDANTNSYVGTTANGVTVFELVLNAQTGEFEFIQYVPIDHPDTASGNDAIMLSFGVNATDGDGDPIQTSIDVTIYDDGPQVFSNGPVVIDETDMSGPVGASVSDQISIEFGADGPGSVEGVADGFSYSVPGPTGPGGFTLTSGGVPVQVSYSDAIGGYIGTANGQTVFTLELNSDGTYTFTLLDTLDHPDTTDINDVINLSFQVVATDGDGDSATTTIEVAVYDDGPELVAAASVSIDETDMSGPVGASVSDTLNIDFGQDGPGSVEGTADGFSYSSPTPTGPAGFTLMSGGEPVSVTFDTASGSYIGTAGGQTVFTLELNADGSYTFTLLGTLDHPNHANPNDVINLAFDVVVTDGDGDMVTTTIDVAVYDDGPQLAPGSSNVSVDETNLGPAGTAVSDTIEVDFGNDGPGTIAGNGNFVSMANGSPIALTSGGVPVTVSYDASTGVYTGSAGGALVFKLTINPLTGDYTFRLYDAIDHPNTNDPNDVINLEFGIIATDGDGDFVNTSVNVSVYDDGPVLSPTVESVSVDESNINGGSTSQGGEIDVDFGSDGAGTITGNGDFDLGGLTSGGQAIAVSYNPATGTYTGIAGAQVIFTLSINSDGTYNFTLLGPVDHPNASNPNDMVDIQFGFIATDGDGDSVEGTINVNIFDDGPQAVNDVETFSTTNGGVSGDVTVNDDFGADGAGSVTQISFGNQTFTIPAGGSTTIDGDYGTLTIFSDGTYTYTLDPGAGSQTISMDPTAAAVAGIQNSVTINGFTLTASFGQDLNWWSGPDGAGIGTGGDKIFGPNDYIEVDMANAADSVTVTVADIGSNNLNDGIDFVVQLANGTSVNYEFDLSTVTVVNGLAQITLDSSMFGGQEIIGFVIFSVNDSALGTASFLINNIEATYPGGDTTDVFEYTIVDADGDSSTATITFNGDAPEGLGPETICDDGMIDGSGGEQYAYATAEDQPVIEQTSDEDDTSSAQGSSDGNVSAVSVQDIIDQDQFVAQDVISDEAAKKAAMEAELAAAAEQNDAVQVQSDDADVSIFDYVLPPYELGYNDVLAAVKPLDLIEPQDSVIAGSDDTGIVYTPPFMPNDDFDIIHPVDLLPPQGSDDTMIGLDDTGMIDASSFTANDDFEIIRPIDMIEPQSDDTTIGLDDTGMIYTPPFVAVEDADAAVQTKPVEASDDVDTLYTPPFMPNDDFDIIHPVDLLPPQSDDTMIGLDDSGMIDASSFTAINDVDSDIGSFVEFTGELQDAINSFIDATSANDNASDTPVAANDGQITDNAGDFAGSCTPYYGGCQPDYSVNTTDEPLLAAHKGSAVL